MGNELTATEILVTVHDRITEKNPDAEKAKIILKKPLTFLYRTESDGNMIWGMHSMLTLMTYAPFDGAWAVSLARYFSSDPDKSSFHNMSLAAFPTRTRLAGRHDDAKYMHALRSQVAYEISLHRESYFKMFTLMHACDPGLALPDDGFRNSKMNANLVFRNHESFSVIKLMDGQKHTLYRPSTVNYLVAGIENALKGHFNPGRKSALEHLVGFRDGGR